jgi:hypothetical protein
VLESLLRALLVIPEIWRRDLLLQFGQFRRLALDVKETSAVLRPVVSALQIQRADPARQSRQASVLVLLQLPENIVSDKSRVHFGDLLLRRSTLEEMYSGLWSTACKDITILFHRAR